ncbi:MAG: acireductone synthase, partial [Actinobacteria bacterium]|nr:acireductone synthase [Actinomycetota bacterium]
CYSEIALSLGVDSPSDILFVTDVLGEAKAAAAAGLSAVIAKRVGNAEITEAHNFKVITSFEQL